MYGVLIKRLLGFKGSFDPVSYMGTLGLLFESHQALRRDLVPWLL